MTGSQKRLDGAASSSIQGRLRSLILDTDENASTCGYCKSSAPTSIARGLWAYRLTVDDYQDLLDRGWRRSGMYLYKPNMQKTCCPQYTIRLQATSFIPSKEQRRVYNRMQRYLDGSYQAIQMSKHIHESAHDKSVDMEDAEESSDSSCLFPVNHPPSVSRDPYSRHSSVKTMDADQVTRGWISLIIKNTILHLMEEDQIPQSFSIPEISVKPVTSKLKKHLKGLDSQSVYTSNVAFALSSNISRVFGSSGSQESMLKSGQTLAHNLEDVNEYSSTMLAELLASKILSSGNSLSLTVEACKGHLNFFLKDSPLEDTMTDVASQIKNEAWPVIKDLKDRKVVFPSAKCTLDNTVVSSSTKHTLDIQMKRSEFDPEEFALYKKYQVAVHNDKPEQVKESAYKRFLVDTPLIPVPQVAEDKSMPISGFGSFHQQYRIDGQLVAVGVVDILPRCLSSKYLFWDPDFAFLSLGKYAALREINWVQESSRCSPSLKYYYLGYYIHSCQKMRYKAAYCPSELLCPETFTWVPYALAKPLLDKQSYACLSKVFLEKLIPRTAEARYSQGTSFLENIIDTKDIPKVGEIDSPQSSVQCTQAQVEELKESSVNTRMRSADVDELLNDIPIQFKGVRLKFQQFASWGQQDLLKDSLKTYLDGVGSALAVRMDYVLH